MLHFWDFRQYRVSNFSAALLDDIYTHPVYDMKSINNTALRRNKALATATTLRRQLKHLQAYLRTCRSGKNLLQTIEDPPHLASEETIYALQDVSDEWEIGGDLQVAEGELSHLCLSCGPLFFFCSW